MSCAITGIGAVTPVGLSARATAAALRAGIARLGPLTGLELDAPAGGTEPAAGGRVPLEWFAGGPKDEPWPGHERFGSAIPPAEHEVVEDGPERLVRLAVPAATEALEASGRSGRPPPEFGLFVGISESETPSAPRVLATAILKALGGFQPLQIDFTPGGRASWFAALAKAWRLVEEGKLAGALVGGVDSLVRPATLRRLAAAGILKDPEANPQGVLPGEAAAFVVLEGRPRERRTLALLLGAATAEEPTAGTGEPNRAEGLTTAIRAARAGATMPCVPLTIADLNGDRYRAMELTMASMRALRDVPWRNDLSACGAVWHPADCTGDCGAASGAVNAVWAVEAFRRGYAGIDHVLLSGASDGRLRGAAVLGRGR